MKSIKDFPLEAALWIIALVALFIMQPSGENHFTLCPLALAGFEHCPGCGLGRSISMALHGDFLGSVQYHLLGIPALLLILGRILRLTYQYIQLNYGKSNRTAT